MAVVGSQVGFLAGFPQSFLNTPMDYVRLQLQLGQVHALHQPSSNHRQTAQTPSAHQTYGRHTTPHGSTLPAGVSPALQASGSLLVRGKETDD